MDTAPKNRVFIIDGSSFLYRAYYSIRPLHTKDGIAVQAVYGFCRMIKKLIDTYQPHAMVLVWDSKGKTVRHEMYEDYKDSRQAAPSDLVSQKELIQEFANNIGLIQVQMQGVEADDLMYSIAKDLEREQCPSVFVTSDKDMGQAVSDYITILDPFKEAFITVESLQEKLGFEIAKIPFYYALVGDAADSIPGVKGIGPKGAQQLVQQFNSLEDLYAGINAVKSARIQELLINAKAEAFLSEQLFILRIYDTALTAQSCIFERNNWHKARAFFEKLEFKTLVKDIDSQSSDKLQSVSSVPTLPLHGMYTFILVNTKELLNEVCNHIRTAKHCALDTEGDGLKPLEANLIGISVCVQEGVSYYIPFGHITDELQLSKTYVLEQLKPLFEDKCIAKYLHHAKFDALMLYHAGIELKGIVFDTMIAASLVVPEGQRIGLKYLSEYYFQEPMLFWNDVVKKNKYKDFSYVPLGIATEYAAADAHQTYKLYNLFMQEVHDRKLQDLLFHLEMPTMQVLYEMEKEGIFVDFAVLEQINTVVTHDLAVLRNAITDLLGESFATLNLNSPKQLEDLLFNYLKLPAVKKTTQKTGYSTDQEVLKELALLHPVPGLIAKYRELYKIKSTYLEGLRDAINPHTAKVHTTFSQTAVTTGRLSSSEPNLQNIPVDKLHVRAAFKPSENYLFLSADYSQIELRVLAYLSQDTTLLSAFTTGQDIHTLTAAGLFDVPLESVTHEQRQTGKRINFSILYGL
ncbi:MAG: DNA polymerase I, partial [Tatlockia sp.]|nr:DNA polymerase I [Tatlockia sp.]